MQASISNRQKLGCHVTFILIILIQVDNSSFLTRFKNTQEDFYQ